MTLERGGATAGPGSSSGDVLRVACRVAAALYLLLTWGMPAALADDRPNIVVIMFDDYGQQLGAYGDPNATTPHLDTLAREGVRFTNAFATAPVCGPSRAAIMTGVHQQALGASHQRTRGLAPSVPGGGPISYEAVPPGTAVKSFTELLRAAGYFTVRTGKADYQFGEPVTMWDRVDSEFDVQAVATRAPFFAFVNLNHTHERFLWPNTTTSDNERVRATVAQNIKETATRRQVADPSKVRVPSYLPDTPLVRADLARNYDNGTWDDERVGAVVASLRRAGVYDRTVVIMTADNGDGLPRMKRAVYDAGLRVPLIVRWPGRVAAGTVRTDLVSLVDLAPTVLAAAGIPRPAHYNGRVFIGPETHAAPPFVFAAVDRLDSSFHRRKTVVDDRWQYVRHYDRQPLYRDQDWYQAVMPTMQELRRLLGAGTLTPAQRAGFLPVPEEELFDLHTDPETTRNLAAVPRYGEELSRLRTALDEFNARHGDLTAMPESMLIEMMWPGGRQPLTAVPLVETAEAGEGRRVTLRCETPGASIAWQWIDEAGERWRLYTGPIDVPGERGLHAKAIRYGYRESAVATLAPR